MVAIGHVLESVLRPVSQSPYLVLARKYRPQTFAELIGQDAMVRTLKNALDKGRLAHAFILTGVRGVGKTTTARLIARALNCVGADGQGGPTVSPCGVCAFCRAIAESRDTDVIEMDAASHTGVDNMRGIIDNVAYAAAAARYKIYIIDEVHMLSKGAFNALLKTLEEPPAHVKFIFATTEIRKVPITVLSRCQRFDLRRVDTAVLTRHLAAIAEREGVEAEAQALGLIAQAAEGSVRDALSLLDQAIAHAEAKVEAEAVRRMIGLADRHAVIGLYRDVMAGRLAEALGALGTLYQDGADPLLVLEDMLAFTHWLTRLKVAPELAAAPDMAQAMREQGQAMAEALGMAALTRNWQLLLKGIAEVRTAGDSLAATEMVLVRLAHAAQLPSPADLVRSLKNGDAATGSASASGPAPAGGGVTALRPQPAADRPRHEAAPADFKALVAMLEARKEGLLALALSDHVHVVRYQPPRLEFRPTARAPRDLASRLMHCLKSWTGRDWQVVVSNEDGAPLLREQLAEAEARDQDAALALPQVQAVMQAFPGARLVAVRDRAAPERQADVEAPRPNSPDDEDWYQDLIEDQA
ncbi:MAG: DNA polymerase III subunit gamma/tau [Sphingomonadales bacterium]